MTIFQLSDLSGPSEPIQAVNCPSFKNMTVTKKQFMEKIEKQALQLELVKIRPKNANDPLKRRMEL